ncbi:MAG: peptidoglycan-binding protein [Methylococcaceae bacterium]
MKTTTKLQILIVFLFPVVVFAYPLDGYNETGIRRIEAARLAVFGEMKGRKQPPGALLPNQSIELQLLDYPALNLPPPDPGFTAKISKLLGKSRKRYGISILDISDPNKPLYAEYRGNYRQNVGSVGKILVGLALFQALADIYPDDIEARKKILRETIVTADNFIYTDHHTVGIFNPESKKKIIRPLKIGDQGNLWEWLDWMLSASSNAAAATVMKQAMLLNQYGKDYPQGDDESIQFFNNTPRKALNQLFVKTFIDPLSRNGLDPEFFRQGSFFTRYGKKKASAGSSYGTARQLMLFNLRMEQGRLVDTFSSKEIKRLLYMTGRRIRYASAPALAESAIYFKSGSLYKCKPEPDFVCEKYRGNVRNYMNSLALVESPVGENRINYMVTLLSNVLYKNSAVAHQTLGTRIHRAIEALHPYQTVTTEGIPIAASFGGKLIGYEEKRKQRLQIVNTQAALEKLGYAVGGVDGKIGSKTRRAIKKFQSTHKIKADGKTSAALLEQLEQVLELTLKPPHLEQ